MARCFKDSTGREWSVNVVVDTIEKVREIGVDLGDVTAQAMKRLAIDDVLLVRSLWFICEAQADKAGVNPQQFGESLFGDALDDAYEALRGALDDFFPRRKREFWRKMMEVDSRQQVETMQVGLETMDDPEIREQFSLAVRERAKAEVRKALTQLRSATGSPG